MELSVGSGIWVPCQVKPGPFFNERRVRIVVEGNDWFGFVDVEWLKNKTEEGDDEVLAKVVDIEGSQFRARIPGSAPQPSLFEAGINQVAPSDPVEA